MIGSYSFNQDTTRHIATKMIILHAYSLKGIDHISFKEFCVVMRP